LHESEQNLDNVLNCAGLPQRLDVNTDMLHSYL